MFMIHYSTLCEVFVYMPTGTKTGCPGRICQMSWWHLQETAAAFNKRTKELVNLCVCILVASSGGDEKHNNVDS